MLVSPENLRGRRLSGFARKAHHTVQTQQNGDFVAASVSVCAGVRLFAVGDTALFLYRARTQQNKEVLLRLNATLAF